MSILLVLVALVALVFVGGAVIGVYFVMRGDSSADRGRLVTATNAQLGERATDVAFFLRFEQQDALDAQALVQRYQVQLSPSETRDVALELTRLVSSATHAYLGPCSWPPIKAYSPVTQGVIVGYRARTRVSSPRARRCLGAPTLAMYAYWRGVGETDAGDTLVEAGRDSWYWGAPLPDEARSRAA